jgi:hypothetical protein
MVVVQCPHCFENVELEQGAFGSFTCPHCDEEFEYESDTNSSPVNLKIKSGLNVTSKVGLGLLFFSILMLIFGLVYLNMAYNGFTESANSTECTSSIPFSILPVCTAEGNWGIGSLCCSISLILVGIGVGFGATVSLLTGAVSGNKKVIIVQSDK